MNKKYLLIVIVAFILSFGLAQYVSKNSLWLPAVFNQSLHWFEALLGEATAIKEDLISNEPFPPEVHTSKQYKHTEVGNAPTCKDTSLGELKYKKVGDIYLWEDENGIRHFSDAPPKVGNYEVLNYAGEKVLDYFSLDLNTESLPYDFNQKLTVKLNKLFALYGKLLDTSSLKKVDINLQVVASKTAYQSIQKAHNMAIGNQSNGFYSYGTNKAYLLFTNNEQTMKTATHEATHAINRAIIGYSHKWLNEGLAEYSEGIRVSGQVANIYPNDSWTRNGRISEKILPLEHLFSARSKEWNGKLRQRLYASSWAFIYFMMENTNRKTMLAKIIDAEQQNICDVIEKQHLEDIFGMSFHRLQTEFSKWTKTKIRSQSL